MRCGQYGGAPHCRHWDTENQRYVSKMVFLQASLQASWLRAVRTLAGTGPPEGLSSLILSFTTDLLGLLCTSIILGTWGICRTTLSETKFLLS